MGKLMAPDERDRRFDKALARHLRSAASPAGEAAGLPAVPASQGDVCPDSETLAAYHERSLLPEEVNSWKEHIVGCALCQSILAQLEATDEISLQAVEQEEILAVKESEPVMAARNLESFPETAAASQSQRAAEAAPPKKSRRALLLRGARWQWLAPAGAIAAGLLVWIALHENQPLPRPALPENENKVAQNREPAAPLPSVSTGSPQSSAPSKSAASLPHPKPPVRQYAGSEGRGVSEAAKQSGMGMGTGVGKSPDDKELDARKDDKREIATDQLAATNRAELDTKKLPLTSRQEVQVQSQSQVVIVEPEIAQSQNSQTQNQSNNYVLQKAPGPSQTNQAKPSKKSNPETAASPAPPPSRPQGAAVGVAADYSTSESLAVPGMISNPPLISPPRPIFLAPVAPPGPLHSS